MKEIIKGWVIVCYNHPNSGSTFISSGSFRQLRKHAISDFVYGTNSTWAYWKRKYNFKCVKSKSTIEIS